MKKAQAAVFDGIMFLLLVSFSVTLMFSFLSDYGNAQAKTLQSSHTLNYVQGIGKALYTLDVSMLQSTDLDTLGNSWNYENCNTLEKFRSNTVSDLIKRDISDGFFNNKFGDSDDISNAPGKLALRCALFELMKPVTGSGYDYLAEVLDGDRSPRFAPFPIINSPQNRADLEPVLVTNLPTSDSIYLAAEESGCDSVSRTLKGKQLMAVATPFRVFDKDGGAHDHQLRICMWPSERTP